MKWTNFVRTENRTYLKNWIFIFREQMFHGMLGRSMQVTVIFYFNTLNKNVAWRKFLNDRGDNFDSGGRIKIFPYRTTFKFILLLQMRMNLISFSYSIWRYSAVKLKKKCCKKYIKKSRHKACKKCPVILSGKCN